jgi:hypothetical protein
MKFPFNQKKRLCSGRVGQVEGKVFNQTVIGGLEKFQTTTNPPTSTIG